VPQPFEVLAVPAGPLLTHSTENCQSQSLRSISLTSLLSRVEARAHATVAGDAILANHTAPQKTNIPIAAPNMRRAAIPTARRPRTELGCPSKEERRTEELEPLEREGRELPFHLTLDPKVESRCLRVGPEGADDQELPGAGLARRPGEVDDGVEVDLPEGSFRSGLRDGGSERAEDDVGAAELSDGERAEIDDPLEELRREERHLLPDE